MKDRYRLLYTDDFLAGLDISLETLRFQCEQELKGKLLKLRQFYLDRAESTAALERLPTKSLSSFMVLFTEMIRLKRISQPQSNESILSPMSELGLLTAALVTE
jgi:hypothetical protein